MWVGGGGSGRGAQAVTPPPTPTLRSSQTVTCRGSTRIARRPACPMGPGPLHRVSPVRHPGPCRGTAAVALPPPPSPSPSPSTHGAQTRRLPPWRLDSGRAVARGMPRRTTARARASSGVAGPIATHLSAFVPRRSVPRGMSRCLRCTAVGLRVWMAVPSRCCLGSAGGGGGWAPSGPRHMHRPRGIPALNPNTPGLLL